MATAAASRTVISNPFYVAKKEEEAGLHTELSPAPEEPDVPDEVEIAGTFEDDEWQQGHAMFVMTTFWTLVTSPTNAVAGLAAAAHVNIYLLSLALILSTPYFNVMSTLQVAVLGTIVLQVVSSWLSPYKSFAIAHADSVPAAVMVQVIASASEIIDMRYYETQGHQKTQWELARNITTAPEVQDCLLGIAEYPEECFPYVECWEDTRCKQAAHTTVFIAIVVGNLFVALSLFILGSGHAARVIAFVPTTVQAAFLAGVGFKIFKMGVTFMITKKEIKKLFSLGMYDGTVSADEKLPSDARRMLGDTVSSAEDPSNTLAGVFVNFAVVVFLAVVINVAEMRLHHNKYIGKWVWPLMLVFLTSVFYIVLAVYARVWDVEYGDAYDHALTPGLNGSHFPVLPGGIGWLMNDKHTSSDAVFPQYDNLSRLSFVYWGAIFSLTQLANYCLLVVITVLSILLNTVAIEEETNQDIDFDNELRTVALGNFLASFLGGFTGYASSAKTLTCHHMGGRHYAGLWSALYFTVFVFVGKHLAAIIPVPVIGGFIAAIGIELMIEWMWHMRHKLSRTELYELGILFLMMTWDFVGGFTVGMMLSLLSFTARYVQTPVIKITLDGNQFGGRAMRGWRDKTILMRYGSQILTMRLQGFIFFATAERLRQSVTDELHRRREKGRQVKFLVLDFHAVDNIDTTAAKKLKKLMRFCKDEGTFVVYSDISEDIMHQLSQDEVDEKHFDNMKVMHDIDVSFEWCSDQILQDPIHQFSFIKPDKATGKYSVQGVIRGMLTYIRVGFVRMIEGERFDSVSFREIGSKRVYHKGDRVARQSDWFVAGNELFYIAKGSCIKIHEWKYGNRRVEKRYAGNVIGELAYYLKQPRTESVYADEDDTVIYSFTPEQLGVLKKDFPHLEEDLLKHCMHRMSETIRRLHHENHVLQFRQGMDDVVHSSDEEDEVGDEPAKLAPKASRPRSPRSPRSPKAGE
jgi:MFS superfamily sulfate permease-like transporter/CRP-like cAMP-binding protein